MVTIGKRKMIISSEIPRSRQKIYTKLIEIDATTGLPTGRKKANMSDDPDYIPPIQL